MADVSMTALVVSDIRPNDWVAVWGLGMVGNIAAQAFQAVGCRVIGIEPNAARCRLAKKCGIRQVISGPPEEAQEQIARITAGKMAAISVDATGHSAAIMLALKATATFGQLILLGSPRVPVQANITEFLSDVHLRWVTVKSALEWCMPVEQTPGCRYSLVDKQLMIFDWMQRGLLKLEPQISHRMRPSQIKEAYEGLLNQPDKFTGVVLDWRK